MTEHARVAPLRTPAALHPADALSRGHLIVLAPKLATYKPFAYFILSDRSSPAIAAAEEAAVATSKLCAIPGEFESAAQVAAAYGR